MQSFNSTIKSVLSRYYFALHSQDLIDVIVIMNLIELKMSIIIKYKYC
jgi:hypothetical protein